MSWDSRRAILAKISSNRGGRKQLCFLNFDRQPQGIPGLSTIFHSDSKEVIYRLLKNLNATRGIDLVLYTRGGDTNSVWPLVSLIREFDPAFEVLVPFRCHSSGTLVALGAKVIHMNKIAELSPIDPTTANQFNPVDEARPGNMKAISVEDVTAFTEFAKNGNDQNFLAGLQFLASTVHPLALGNVQRVYKQTRQLADKLLKTNSANFTDEAARKAIVEKLSTGFYSHLHSISRVEAREILGEEHVKNTSDDLENLLDELLREYELNFELRRQYSLSQHIADQPATNVSYVGGVIETDGRSYIFETKGTWRQSSKLPPNVQLNLPPGTPMPIIPGLPREQAFELLSQDWAHNAGGR